MYDPCTAYTWLFFIHVLSNSQIILNVCIAEYMISANSGPWFHLQNECVGSLLQAYVQMYMKDLYPLSAMFYFELIHIIPVLNPVFLHGFPGTPFLSIRSKDFNVFTSVFLCKFIQHEEWDSNEDL